jgi:hypothetical protein
VFVLIESITYDPNSKEMPHDVALNFVWGAVEVNLAVFSGKRTCFLSLVFHKKMNTSIQLITDTHTCSLSTASAACFP